MVPREDLPHKVMLSQPSEMIFMLMTLTKIRTLDKKCLRVLNAFTFPCYSSVTSSGFWFMHFPSYMGHDTQEKSFLDPGDRGSQIQKTSFLISNASKQIS